MFNFIFYDYLASTTSTTGLFSCFFKIDIIIPTDITNIIIEITVPIYGMFCKISNNKNVAILVKIIFGFILLSLYFFSTNFTKKVPTIIFFNKANIIMLATENTIAAMPKFNNTINNIIPKLNMTKIPTVPNTPFFKTEFPFNLSHNLVILSFLTNININKNIIILVSVLLVILINYCEKLSESDLI